MAVEMFSVPDQYTWAEAMSLGSPGDVVVLAGTVIGPVTLSKAMHIRSANYSGGYLPTSTYRVYADSSNAPLTINIPANAWGDVKEVIIEGIRIHNHGGYTSSAHQILDVGDMPLDCRVMINCCTLAGYPALYNHVVASDHSSMVFTNCWLTTRWFETHASPYYIPMSQASTSGTSNCVFERSLATLQDGYDGQEDSLAFYSADFKTYDAGSSTYGPAHGTLLLDDYPTINRVLYGVIKDIPDTQDKNDFLIQLFEEDLPVGSNVRKIYPKASKGINHTTGEWRFERLRPDHRLGVLIQPPEGMQGHWLRWYQPEALIEEEEEPLEEPPIEQG